MDQTELKRKEELYLRWKQLYDDGVPEVSDYEFDMLEDELKFAGSLVIKKVGTVSIGKANEIAHTFRMLSLAKTNVYDLDINDAIIPLADITKFMNKSKIKDDEFFESSPKFDGSSMEIVYKNGILTSALTRGDGSFGFEHISKIKHLVPRRLPEKYGKLNIEIRGEIVILKEAFNRKWSVAALGEVDGYMNARNFVAGIISREEYDPKIWEDFVFVAYFVREYSDINNWNFLPHTFSALTEMGFNSKYPIFVNEFKTIEEFKSAYIKTKDYRENTAPFLLDGMVLTFPESYRIKLGENDHDPEWGYAVKFPPVVCITKTIGIDWNTGSTGEVVPTAVMKPVDLDGSTVQRASLFNAGHVLKTGLWPGATVEIYKAGDIIPQIKRVVVAAPAVGTLPTECPSCKSTLILDDIHLWCRNGDCPSQVLKKIEAGKNAFKIKNVGMSSIKDLYDIGITRFMDYFDSDKLNKTILLKSGRFVQGRSLDIILEEIAAVKKVDLESVILALKLPDTGRSVSKQVARYLVGLPHDFAGLTATSVAKFTTKGSPERSMLNEFVSILNRAGIKLIKPSDDTNTNLPTYVMTGTPPKIKDLKQKSDYSKIFATKGFKEVDKLDANVSYLITDDLKSTSGKMSNAAKLKAKGSNIEVITYEDFYKRNVGVIPGQTATLF